MMRRHKLPTDDRGWTLPEILVVCVLMTILSSAMLLTVSLIQEATYERAATVELTNKARAVVEEMVWGIRTGAGVVDRRGIIEATGAVVTPNQIDYDDIDGDTHSIRLNNDRIEYRLNGGAWTALMDASGAAAFDATQYTVTLNFTQPVPNAVQIRLVVGKTVQGRWQYASISTQASFRNA
ncbi:MAG: hypothetical protein MOGMAGMI_02060 [Candidatus Omnitrophica bacterium]|nr:hypothetical protein [Candidatus Omnitrophota bacterium]